MTDRLVICAHEPGDLHRDEGDRTWTRVAVWEDGEWVEGYPPVTQPRVGSDRDELTRAAIIERVDGPQMYAFEPEDAPA